MSDEQKSVEFYGAMVNAWLNTKFEHDKSLVTLSAGGIALLVTLLTTAGVYSLDILFIYMAALGSFLVCLVTLLYVFRRNATHLEYAIKNGERQDDLLVFLDRVVLASFVVGVVLSSIIGALTAIHSYKEGEIKMPEEKKQQEACLKQINESLEGVMRIAPANIRVEKLSVEGIGRLNPINVAVDRRSDAATPSIPQTPQDKTPDSK